LTPHAFKHMGLGVPQRPESRKASLPLDDMNDELA
jgi:hypothetical protein